MNIKKGFSLIEIIIVVSIICTLYFVVSINLVNTIELLRIKNEAQKLALNLQYLRNNSLSFSQDGICYLYGNRYVLKVKKYNGSENILREVLLNENINISGQGKIGFKYNGNPLFSGTVILKNKKGFERKVIVAVATGRIRIE